MDPDVEKQLTEIDRKLELLMDLRQDLKDHMAMDRHLFYGESGANGLVGDVNELKQSRRFYNKVLAILATGLAGLVGEGVWRLTK